MRAYMCASVYMLRKWLRCSIHWQMRLYACRLHTTTTNPYPSKLEERQQQKRWMNNQVTECVCVCVYMLTRNIENRYPNNDVKWAHLFFSSGDTYFCHKNSSYEKEREKVWLYQWFLFSVSRRHRYCYCTPNKHFCVLLKETV